MLNSDATWFRGFSKCAKICGVLSDLHMTVRPFPEKFCFDKTFGLACFATREKLFLEAHRSCPQQRNARDVITNLESKHLGAHSG